MNFIPVEAQVPSLVSHPEFRLALPSEWDGYLKPYEGKPVTLGIRPEHVSLALPAPKKHSRNGSPPGGAGQRNLSAGPDRKPIANGEGSPR